MKSALERVSIALTAPFLGREEILRATLNEIDCGLLDVRLPDVEPASPTTQIAVLFCKWAATSQTLRMSLPPVRDILILPEHSLPLVKFANKIGQPHLAKLVIEHAHLVLDTNPDYQFDDNWFEFELQVAKSYRLLGEHEAAIRVYHKLLVHSKNASPYYVPRVLLNLGKMSHSYEWRTGLYLQLSKIAESRFRFLLNSNRFDTIELKRQIAICIDCRCQTELSINDRNESEAIFTRWAEALSLSHQSESVNSYLRIRLRFTYARFHFVEDQVKRADLLKNYVNDLKKIENLGGERRGLAVRYGQLADMLGAVGRFGEADDYLQAAIEHSCYVSDWRVLAHNVIRNSALKLRIKRFDSQNELDMLSMALARLRGSSGASSTAPADIEVALLRQLARHHSALGNNQKARHCLNQVVDSFEEFERRILDETSDPTRAPDTLSIKKTLDAFLDEDEKLQIHKAGMVDYQILARYERSVINELLDTINSDMRHLGSKQQVNISRLAVSTVLHDQKGRIDRLLSELHNNYVTEFQNDENILPRVLCHLKNSTGQVQDDFHAGLAKFALRNTNNKDKSRRSRAVSIATAFKDALERGRFESRYPDIEFQFPTTDTRIFEIAVDADLLISVFDNLLQNATTAILANNHAEQYVRVTWDWRENAEQLNPTAYIFVEDTGGAVNQLKNGLHFEEGGRYGLKLAKMFFDGLRGEMSVSGEDGVKTVLTISLQASEMVRLL